jgi:iron complex transport system substrate-binding protein
MRALLIILSLAFTYPAQAEQTHRIVSLGSSITEILYAIGAQDQIVAVDSGSLYPEAAKALPKTGYMRTLSAEGLLSLQPTIIIATSEAGPPQALAYLKDAGVELLILPEMHTLEGVEEKITAIAKRLEESEKGNALIDALHLAEKKLAEPTATQPKAVFVSSRGAHGLMAAGTNTAAHAMLSLAGARNVADSYTGYKPLSAEYLMMASPDVIVTGLRTLDTTGGEDTFLKTPALQDTPAGRQKKVVAMDDIYILGFGPRSGQAALDLAGAVRK